MSSPGADVYVPWVAMEGEAPAEPFLGPPHILGSPGGSPSMAIEVHDRSLPAMEGEAPAEPYLITSEDARSGDPAYRKAWRIGADTNPQAASCRPGPLFTP